MRYLSYGLLGVAVLFFLGRLAFVAGSPPPAPQDLADLPPMAALAPTATALQATPVVVAVATAETLPPDVNLGWAVRKEAGGQVSFGYVTNQAQPQTYFTCTQLDSDVRFAGLSTYQQRVVREMCNQE